MFGWMDGQESFFFSLSLSLIFRVQYFKSYLGTTMENFQICVCETQHSSNLDVPKTTKRKLKYYIIERTNFRQLYKPELVYNCQIVII